MIFIMHFDTLPLTQWNLKLKERRECLFKPIDSIHVKSKECNEKVFFVYDLHLDTPPLILRNVTPYGTRPEWSLQQTATKSIHINSKNKKALK